MKVSKLKALMMGCAKNGNRPELGGIYVCGTVEDLIFCSTDGHIAIVISGSSALQVIAEIYETHGLTYGEQYNIGSILFLDVKIRIAMDARIVESDMKYPDIRRVIPSEYTCERPRPVFSIDTHVRLSKIHNLVGGVSGYVYPMFWGSPISAAISVYSDGEIIVLGMPCRLVSLNSRIFGDQDDMEYPYILNYSPFNKKECRK